MRYEDEYEFEPSLFVMIICIIIIIPIGCLIDIIKFSYE
jgi:hypothetical protein